MPKSSGNTRYAMPRVCQIQAITGIFLSWTAQVAHPHRGDGRARQIALPLPVYFASSVDAVVASPIA
jgi:hypothetical protein